MNMWTCTLEQACLSTYMTPTKSQEECQDEMLAKPKEASTPCLASERKQLHHRTCKAEEGKLSLPYLWVQAATST